MDIVYEKVSMEDAKKAINGHIAIESEPQRWTKRRAQSTPERLLPDTLKWMAQLPHYVRPFKLGRQYPRIANEIGRLWKLKARCEDYMKALLLVDGAGR